jgi:hypothetical protein
MNADQGFWIAGGKPLNTKGKPKNRLTTKDTKEKEKQLLTADYADERGSRIPAFAEVSYARDKCFYLERCCLYLER